MQTKTFAAVAVLFLAATLNGCAATNRWNFSFGSGKAAAGHQTVSPTNLYNTATGFGFEPGATNLLAHPSHIDSPQPFYFSVALPEGNYRVTATFAGGSNGSTNTVKSELRRLMLEHVAVAPGKTAMRRFTVNVRRPEIPGGGPVRLKDRERTSEIWNWDEKLTLEFNGSHPALASLEIQSADELPTVYLLGDSTVCDQPREPWNSWGQMLPRFLSDRVVVANHAESGETLRSSFNARRLDKVLSTMKPGDYLLIQFGHNDMKERDTNSLANYEASLKKYIAGAKAKGGIPVLVTSMERKGGVDHDTLGQYPATVRAVARQENVALIDLHALSRTLYNALGRDLDKAFQDGTHHNNFGSYELAKCIAAALKKSSLPLAKAVADDFKDFDPARPDAVATFDMPASPGNAGPRPLGD
ncbi:MAG: rhamnogalacturonan acetylesterase [Verrucomicrobiota bacterium]